MPKVAQTTIRCPSCGQSFPTNIQTLVDVGQEPRDKERLLTGRLNVAQCPYCGTAAPLATPLLYHDPKKELLIAYIPMELNLSQQDQERIIGELMRELPKESFKAYMFQPRRALTTQGLIDQILEADGVTPEMMERQRARVRLIQTMLETPEEELPALIEQHDAEIDAPFIQALTLMAQRMLQEGHPDVAEQVVFIQGKVVELSSYGKQLQEQAAAQEQLVQEVAQELQTLGEDADQSDILDMAIRYADDGDRLQALVGLIRPAFDYNFFQELTLRIGQAPADQRETLEKMRDRILELTSLIDQQAQAALQNAARLLQVLVSSPNPDEMIAANLPLIDDTFMAVLSANIQEAERRKDINATGKLKGLYDRIVAVLRENMRPELRFVNELLATENDDNARTMIAERAKEFGTPLLDVIDSLGQMLESQGEQDMVERLAFFRRETEQALG
jgi:hypothetical protein